MPVPRTRADLVLALFDEFYERVYAFLRKSTSPEVAEDLAQEVFVRLLQHPELERLTISVSYLLKIAHNLMRRRYARATRLRELLHERLQQERVTSDGLASPADDDHSGEMPLFLDSAVLEAAMGLLTSDEHSAVRLIVCEGRSYQHAAQSLGVTVTTINNWKHRGLTKMRRYLAEAERGDCAGHHRRPGYLNDDLGEVAFACRPAERQYGPAASRARSISTRRPGWCAASDDVA
jgi:RNA polymerase sigma-70 factor (ECF subfamily)